jgi:CheY-like chemotaxis protein
VNLLSNAVKFTPEGGQIGLEVVGVPASHEVRLTVWDSGIGISEEGLDILFEPFVQLDSRLAREFSGTGLGLSLVQRMMDLHGGSVSVESELGVGSRFTVSFPWQGSQAMPLSFNKDQTSATKISAIFPLALVVDDSPAATEQLKRYLNELGIEVITNSNGDNLVAQVISLRPDIIFLDILFPNTSGWELLGNLKAQPKTQVIPVVVASVIDEQENVLAAGGVDCLLKPVTRQQLDVVLQRVAAAQDVAKQAAQSLTHLEAQATAVRPRILLAEDNEANVNTFSHYLNAKGYDIIVAGNGREAIELALKEVPDLILMDIQMPQVNGLEAIKEIRAAGSVKDIHIIAVTALAMPGDLEKCLEAGANDYLSKPVSLKGLLERIQQQLI